MASRSINSIGETDLKDFCSTQMATRDPGEVGVKKRNINM